MAGPFAAIAESYGNIISEAKGRLMIVNKALAAPDPKDVLDYVAVSDLCALQFRKIFEAVALGCLAMHGDLPGTKRLKDDAYRADKLLASLAKLNPNFYPQPCVIVERAQCDGGQGKVKNIRRGWLTKEELRRLYFVFDHEMHVGSLMRRQPIATVIGLGEYRTILTQTELLLRVHWITRIDGSHVLCDTSSNKGPILIDVVTVE